MAYREYRLILRMCVFTAALAICAACSTPTDPAIQPAAPHFNGGMIGVGGGRMGVDSTATTTADGGMISIGGG